MVREGSSEENVVQKKAYKAAFLKRGKWWIAWCEDVPGALTQGRTRQSARNNLRDAIRMMLESCDLRRLPKARVHRETIRL